MKTLFFYGTMRHIELLKTVLGRGADALMVAESILPGFRVSSVAEGPFPMIAVDPQSQAKGLSVSGLTDDDITRLDYYEGSFAYDLTQVTLQDGQAADVYVPQPGLWTADGDWSLAAWQETWGEISVVAAREVMGYLGTRSRDEVATMFSVIRSRAAAQVRARTSQHGADGFAGKVEIDSRVRSYSDFYALDDLLIRHSRFDGSMSPTLDRAVFMGTDAAFVLPYDPRRDRVLLVEQVRIGPIGRGDRTLWQLEAIAGRIDPGETPEQAVRREAQEEAGLTLGALEKIAESYPTPGTSSEFNYVYLGLADLPDMIAGTAGLAAENEDIRSHLLSFEDLMARVQRFDLANGTLIMAAYYLAQHRDRLRSLGTGDTP